MRFVTDTVHANATRQRKRASLLCQCIEKDNSCWIEKYISGFWRIVFPKSHNQHKSSLFFASASGLISCGLQPSFQILTTKECHALPKCDILDASCHFPISKMDPNAEMDLPEWGNFLSALGEGKVSWRGDFWRGCIQGNTARAVSPLLLGIPWL